MFYWGLFAAVLVGVSLGLLGAGGSILTVPILTYIFGVDPTQATTFSMFVVGITSSIAAFRMHRNRLIHWKTAIVFAVPSLAAMLWVRKFVLPKIPEYGVYFGFLTLSKDRLILVLFGILLLAAASAMLFRRSPQTASVSLGFPRLFLRGISVGIVTGFTGAGGGFLLVPALVMFAGLPIKSAMATSLVIISVNTVTGFCADFAMGVTMDWFLLASFSACAVGGMLLGIKINTRISSDRLQKGFGWFVLIIGLGVLGKELFL